MGRVLITGAAGNLGTLLARDLLSEAAPTSTVSLDSRGRSEGQRLRLMVHRRALADDLAEAEGVEVVEADLGQPDTLARACAGVEVIVHFAGVLFRPWPERFLPRTNTRYFENLVDVALATGVRKIVLISFPHVEGETTPDHPARGRLDGRPASLHARTRLEEERYLLTRCEETTTVPVVLRVGMIYGPGVLMIEAGRWLLRHHLLAVWPLPTWIHLIATADFLAAARAALEPGAAGGIYHLGDEQPVTLQDFLDRLADRWGYRRPWRLPLSLIYVVAFAVEVFATIFRTAAPLTRDFVRIGSASYCGDTGRMRSELLPELRYPTLTEGLAQFVET